MNEATIINLPKIEDLRGNLSFLEELKQIPFTIKKTHWIYDVPGGEIRGSHAFKSNKEFIIALSGSFDVVLHDGEKEHRYFLNRSYYGLYVPNMTWRTMENYSSNSLALIISSEHYDENDYIWDFERFIDCKNDTF
jgi:hypothetical protein